MPPLRLNLPWYGWLGGLLLLVLSAATFNTLKLDPLYARALSQTDPASVRFAIIGDFGVDTQDEADVATLVKSWTPDLILTVGDNNYPDGAASTIDSNIGQYYHEYISPYTGTYGTGATENRFFPTLGNHDWHTITCTADTCSGAYFDYFTLPGNERYYDFVRGPVHFFVIDSDPAEPDGRTATSLQAAWLRDRLAASTAPWKLVFMHHAPYSSSTNHGSQPRLQWPYAEWGAHAVFAGHDHLYERVTQNGIPYFVNGAGGANLYVCGTPVPGSQLCYAGDHGAMLVTANSATITFEFHASSGQLIDSYSLNATNLPTPTAPPPPGYEVRISQSSDDAEEIVGTGNVALASSDLELIDDPSVGLQKVGLRFANVSVPQGITITNAYVEFTVDEINNEPTSLLIHGQAVDHALPFTDTAANLSLRPQTVVSVTWSALPAWETVGLKQRTPNLAPIIQEIVNRPGWSSGNALTLIISGSGHRTAEATDKGSDGAPLLHIAYPGAPTPTATPTVGEPVEPTPTATQTPTPTATAPGQSVPQGSWLPFVRR